MGSPSAGSRHGISSRAAGRALHHGVRVYTHTPVVGVHDGEPCRVETENGEVRAEAVFVAANVPVNNRVWLHTKIAAYRSYAIAVDLAQCSTALGPRDSMPQALFWDTDDPYHYTRMHRIGDRTYILIGGEDHRTGTETDNEESYRRLLEYARERFGIADAAFRWSGQIIEAVDGLPYIGLNTASRSVYVATGFSGNGITFGTLAGRIVSDLIGEQQTSTPSLYAATRVKPLSSAYNYMAENVLFPSHLVRDRLTSLGADSRQVESLQRGEGSVFATEQGRTAICRDRAGILHSVSAVCTHLACDVAWNMAEQTWDCPCHGSRFTPDGKVLNGPAICDLRRGWCLRRCNAIGEPVRSDHRRAEGQKTLTGGKETRSFIRITPESPVRLSKFLRKFWTPVGCQHHGRSTAKATPFPPPRHSAAIPLFRFRC